MDTFRNSPAGRLGRSPSGYWAFVPKVTGQARNRVYRADEVLRTIEEPLSPTDNPPSGEMR